MSKPLGLRMEHRNGEIKMVVPKISRTEDAVWEAVQTAIDEGWNPKSFLLEVESAWDEYLGDLKKDQMREFRK